MLFAGTAVRMVQVNLKETDGSVCCYILSNLSTEAPDHSPKASAETLCL